MIKLFFNFCIFSIIPLLASNGLGKLELTEFNLNSNYDYQDKGFKGFYIRDSYIGGSWILNPIVSGVIKVGHSYNKREEFGIYEAYGVVDSEYGQLRSGVLPIEFGFEGSRDLHRNFFSPSLFYQFQILPDHDLGASYRAKKGEFSNTLTAFNGEGGKDKDKKLWVMGDWAMRLRSGLEFGLCGAVGPTPLQPDSKSRIGNAFVGLDVYGLSFALEGNSGVHILKNAPHVHFYSGHADIRNPIGKDFWVQARYDVIDLSQDLKLDKIEEGTLGLSYASRYSNSVFTIAGVNRYEFKNKISILRLSWRLNPLYKNKN